MRVRIQRDIREMIAQDSGFSLIEILVATAIASLIMVMAYSSYSTVLKSIRRATGQAEFYENLNLAIMKIDQDLSNAYYNRDNKNLAFICETDGDSSKLSFVTITHNDLNMGGGLKRSNPISDVHEVGYYLKTDKETQGLFYLIKREDLLYDEDPENGGTENVLLENVVSLKFEFLMGNNWAEQWDSRQTRRFPRSVKTTIAVKNYQAKEEKFEFVTTINMMKMM